MTLNDFFHCYFVESVPFSFRYGGNPVMEDFGEIIRDNAEDGLNYQAYRRELIVTDCQSPNAQQFKATLRIRKFSTAIEWWLEMESPGIYDSQIVDELRYADLTITGTETFHPSAWKYPLFHWSHGSLAQKNDFQPVTQNFTPEQKHVLMCNGGLSSSDCMPYFNLQMQDNMGCIFAIGWNGQWRATFERISDRVSKHDQNSYRSVRFSAEMDDARFRVLSSEKLILPKMVAMPWEGNLIDSFNSFRRFIRWDVLPKYDGKPLEGYISLRSWGGFPPEIHKAKFKNVREHGLGAELYQIDAGWHGDESTPKSEHYYFDTWFQTVGIWKPLPALYPEGFRQMHIDCNDAGMEFAVWFEPERMPSWNSMVREHRQYFIGPKLPRDTKDIPNGFSLMLNLGNDDARKWIVDTLSAVIEDSQMRVFRLDFNHEPLRFWKYNDEPDRHGITEIKYVNGVYAMLDELLKRYPQLRIDNCASGGRRLDYRMFRRSIPMLCRSDYFCAQDNEPSPKQAHTYGLSLWIPAHADSVGSCIGHTPEVMDTYRARSTMCSGIGLTAPWWDLSPEEAEWYRKTLADAKTVREYMGYDFYPLTGYTLSEMDWMAYQLHSPEEDKGMVMVFRRELNHTPEMVFQLNGIDESAAYALCDADDGDIGTFSGKEICRMRIHMDSARSSRIITYHRI